MDKFVPLLVVVTVLVGSCGNSGGSAHEPTECEGMEGKSVCVGHAALFCDDGRWISGEDGPCMRADSCDGEAVTVDECLSTFIDCAEQPDGSFCGWDS